MGFSPSYGGTGMGSNGKPLKRMDIGSELPEVCTLPNLIGIQTESYKKFLQLDRLEKGLEPDPSYGLEHIFRTVFPIKSPNDDMMVIYNGYTVDMDGIKYSESECKKKGRSYGVPVKAKVTLSLRSGEMREKEIFFGDFPLMTDRGTFIINGAERVIVSQIVRSPGIVFKLGKRMDASSVFYGTLYPYAGTKVEFALTRKNEKIDTKKSGDVSSNQEKKRVNNIIQVSIGKKPFLVTFFLRVLGIDTRDKIVSAFYTSQKISTAEEGRNARRPFTIACAPGRMPTSEGPTALLRASNAAREPARATKRRQGRWTRQQTVRHSRL